MTENQYRERYHQLFEAYKVDLSTVKVEDNCPNLYDRGFIFQFDEDEQNSDILYIGINPSYSKKVAKKERKEDSYTRTATHKYFKVFQDIDKYLNINYSYKEGNWTHIDLFVFRETKQKIIDDLIKMNTGFLIEQIELTKNRIKNIKPKIIVVANSKVSSFSSFDNNQIHIKSNSILKDNIKLNNVSTTWLNFELMFDETLGTYKIINNADLNGTYILFSSMLTGQRALDLASRDRLLWQILKILQHTNATS